MDSSSASAKPVASQIENSSNKDAYWNGIPGMVKLLRGRTQNHIVLVTDERDNLDVNMAFFDANVDVLRIPEMKLGSVFPLILGNTHFGRGTIWVFSGGIHDLIRSNPLKECLDFGCPSPQSILSLSQSASDTTYLIKTSLELNFAILRNSQNDIALFSWLIPVRINQYNEFAINNRSCFLVHAVKRTFNISNSDYGKYSQTVKQFNDFVRYHSLFLGYLPRNLQVPELGKKTPIANQLHHNGYNIHFGEKRKKAHRARLLCYELLSTLSLKFEERRRAILLSEVHQGIGLTIGVLLEFFGKFGKIERLGSPYAGYLYILFNSESSVANVLRKGSHFVINGRTCGVRGFMKHSSSTLSEVRVAAICKKFASNLQTKEDVGSLNACHENSLQLAPPLGKVKEVSIPDSSARVASICKKLASNLQTKEDVGSLNACHENSLQLAPPLGKVKEVSIPDSSARVASICKKLASNLQTKEDVGSLNACHENSLQLAPPLGKVKEVSIPDSSARVASICKKLASNLQTKEDVGSLNACHENSLQLAPPLGKVKEVSIPDSSARVAAICKKLASNLQTKEDVGSLNACHENTPQLGPPLGKVKEVYIPDYSARVVAIYKLLASTLQTKEDVGSLNACHENTPQLGPPLGKVKEVYIPDSSVKFGGNVPELMKPEVSELHVMKSNQKNTEVAKLEISSLQTNTGLQTKTGLDEAVVMKPQVYQLKLKESSSETEIEKQYLKQYPMEFSPPTFSKYTNEKPEEIELAVHPILSLISQILDKSFFTPDKAFQYDQVIIIADLRYRPFLSHIENPQVVILADEQINIENLDIYLSKNKKNFTSKTLYLLVLGIHSISRTIPLDSCRMIGCSKPLQALELRADFDDFDQFCADYVKMINTTLCNVKSYLPDESNVALLPPLPISLIDSNMHHRLHLHKSLYPDYFVTNRMSNLQQLYTDWAIQILRLSISSMTKISLACQSRVDEVHTLKKLEMIELFIKDKPNYNIWKEVVAAIVNEALSSSISEKVSKPVLDKIPLPLKPSLQPSKEKLRSIPSSIIPLEIDLNDSSIILEENHNILFEDSLVILDENELKTLKLAKGKLDEHHNMNKIRIIKEATELSEDIVRSGETNSSTLDANFVSLLQKAKQTDDDNLDDCIIVFDSTESNKQICVSGEINFSVPQSLHKLQEVKRSDYPIFENCKNRKLTGIKCAKNLTSSRPIQELFSNVVLIDANLPDKSTMKSEADNSLKVEDECLEIYSVDMESTESIDDFKDFCRINSLPYNGILLSPMQNQEVEHPNDLNIGKNGSIPSCSSKIDELLAVQNSSITMGTNNLFNLSLLDTDNDHSIWNESSKLPDLKRTVRSRSHSFDQNLTSEPNAFELSEICQQLSQEEIDKSKSSEEKVESRSNSGFCSERSRSQSFDEKLKFKVITKLNTDGTKSVVLEATFRPQSERSRSNSYSSFSSSSGRSRSRSLEKNAKSRSNASVSSGRSRSRSLEKNAKAKSNASGRSRSRSFKNNINLRENYFLRSKRSRSQSQGGKKKFKSNFSAINNNSILQNDVGKKKLF